MIIYMTMLRHIRLFVIAGALLLFSGCGNSSDWETRFDKALQAAEAQQRDMLVYFNASDRSGQSRAFKENVLDSEVFADFVKERGLLLVELDFPRTLGKTSLEELEARERVRVHYKVQSYPMVLLLDSHGRQYARFGGSAEEPQAYVDALRAAMETEARFRKAVAEAASLDGEERALALAAALQALPQENQSFHEELVQEIIRYDKEDKTGYRAKEEFGRRMMSQVQRFNEFMMKQRQLDSPDRILAARVEALTMLSQEEEWAPVIRMFLNRFISDTFALEKDWAHAAEYMQVAVEAAPDDMPELQSLRTWLEELKKKAAEAQQEPAAEGQSGS